MKKPLTREQSIARLEYAARSNNNMVVGCAISAAERGLGIRFKITGNWHTWADQALKQAKGE